MDITMAPPNEFYRGFEGGSGYNKALVQFHQSVSLSSCKEDIKEERDD